MKCPSCKDTRLVMTDRHDVEIDYCPECRGIWLDRGELDKIIERSASKHEQKYRDYDKQHTRWDNCQKKYYKKKKHKSLLKELFDF